MTRIHSRADPSPDPLALGDDVDMLVDCIKVIVPAPILVPVNRLRRAPTRRGRVKPVVENLSPRKRTQSQTKSDAGRVRTPLMRASQSSNRAAPTPVSKGEKNAEAKPLVTPTKSAVKTPVSRPSVSRSSKPTLSSSVSKLLPNPSPSIPRKRPRLSSAGEDDTFTDPSPSSISAVSREAFLANEALRRQREARKFVYKGDANAPKLTRSGKVVGEVREGTEEVDEYGEAPEEDGGMESDVAQELVMQDEPTILLPTPSIAPDTPMRVAPVVPLPASARPHVLQILSTLTSQSITTNPPAVIDEENNEALQGLLNLFKGTVERGEGNSALVVGARGAGKTHTVSRALSLLPLTSKNAPIIVRLSGHTQTNDRLAIREMGRQIAEAEGRKAVEGEEDKDEEVGEDEEFAPTTLPSHLLALLTTPSLRAIIIILEEFDLFTGHARQALLYCLLDVVQSVKTGPVETTGRGVAVIGLTSRIDTLLLLEKRVKSRFSHRMWRVASPLTTEALGWKEVMKHALVPWEYTSAEAGKEGREAKKWKGDWQFAVEMLLEHEKVVRTLDRLCGLTTDVRTVYRPFIEPMTAVLDCQLDFLSVPRLVDTVIFQVEGAGWGLQNSKLKGLPQPAIGILIIAKHLAYAGREEFNLAQVEEEYLRFSRTKLVGSGKTRWPVGVLRSAFDHLLRQSLLCPTSNSTVKPQFSKVRCTLSPHEVVAWFKGEGGMGSGPELASWGRMMGGHA